MPAGQTAEAVLDSASFLLEEHFAWDGNDGGVGYVASDSHVDVDSSVNSNATISSYTAQSPIILESLASITGSIPLLPVISTFSPVLPPTASISSSLGCMVVAVADTGTTDHMGPNKSAFIMYLKVTKINVHVGNKTLAPVFSKGMAVLPLNGKHVILQNVLHIPVLRNPLHGLRKHFTQHGCGSSVNDSLEGLFVYFSFFVLMVDTAADCHLYYKPSGRNIALQ